ncbi:MAG TPA: 6-carboxytetrahydropterin synthase [Caldithrix sp.]|nr:6-carboxytetrahydropterin synthase [Caldithrix sp.]
MYSVAVKRDFIAQHFLLGGDWGAENTLHSHHYQVELRLEGNDLDRHGYLVDIVEIERSLDSLVSYFRDRSLNELPDFVGLNPSIEHFSRIFCELFVKELSAQNIRAVQVTLWENDIAWAAFRQEIGG